MSETKPNDTAERWMKRIGLVLLGYVLGWSSYAYGVYMDKEATNANREAVEAQTRLGTQQAKGLR